MMNPWLSVIIPTIGRRALDGTLASLRDQPGGNEVELLVIGDTHRTEGMPPPERVFRDTTRICQEYGAHFFEHDGGVNCWGHPQRDFGARAARGRWLWWLQDDDIATRDALAAIKRSIETVDCGIEPPAPRLFRVQTWQAGAVWKLAGRLVQGEIDADCVVAPQDAARLPTWGRRYNGDFDFITALVEEYGGPQLTVWDPALIAVGRPKA